MQKKKSVCKTRLLCANKMLVCKVCANLCTTCAPFYFCVLSVSACISGINKNVCSCVHMCAWFFSRVRAHSNSSGTLLAIETKSPMPHAPGFLHKGKFPKAIIIVKKVILRRTCLAPSFSQRPGLRHLRPPAPFLRHAPLI